MIGIQETRKLVPVPGDGRTCAGYLLMVINWFVLLLMGFADRFVVGGLGEAWLEMCGGGGTEIGVGRWAKMRVDLDLGFGDSRI